MEFKASHASSNATVQMIRHTLLTEVPALRPIAFCIGNNMTLISAGNSVMEDTIEVAANITQPLYCYSEIDRSPDFAVWHGTVDGTLSTADFRSAGIGVAAGPDVEILHTLAPVEVYVVFRHATGGYRRDDNRRFIESCCADSSRFTRSGASDEHLNLLREVRNRDSVYLHSRHCNIRNIKVNIETTDLEANVDKITLDFEYAGKFKPIDILYDAVGTIQYNMKQILKGLEDQL